MATRRTFIKQVIGVGAGAASGASASAQGNGQIAGFDHVAVPMRNTDAMLAFYRRLGFAVREGGRICSVRMAQQKINFHRPSLWERSAFELRASAAEPPCGDFCFVWERRHSVAAREAGCRRRRHHRRARRAPGWCRRGDATGTSFYFRDPDQNLLEFIVY